MCKRLSVLVVPPNDLLRHPIPNRLYHIFKRLARKFMIFLLSYVNHPLANKKVIRKMKCVELYSKPLVKIDELGGYYVFNSLKLKKDLEYFIKTYDLDIVVHANIVPSFIVSKVSRKWNIPTIYDFLDYFPESASFYYRNPLLQKFAKSTVQYIVAHILKMSSHVTTTSYTYRSLLKNIYKDIPITIIPNGVDADVFKPMSEEKAKSIIGIRSDTTVILYYGSVDLWLDIKKFVNIAIALKKHFNGNFIVLILGASHNSMSYYQLNKLIKVHGLSKYFLLRPPVPYRKVPVYISASNLIFAPFKKILHSYSFPLKIVESLACARPVLTSNIYEYKLWFKEFQVFYADTPKEIVHTMMYILRNYEKMHEKLIEDSKKVLEKFSWDHIAEKYGNILYNHAS